MIPVILLKEKMPDFLIRHLELANSEFVCLSGFCACLSLPSIMQPNTASLVIQCSKAKCLHLHEALEIMFTAGLESSSTPCAY